MKLLFLAFVAISVIIIIGLVVYIFYEEHKAGFFLNKKKVTNPFTQRI